MAGFLSSLRVCKVRITVSMWRSSWKITCTFGTFRVSIFKLNFGKWVSENRFKELAVSLYNSYCKITWIRVNYSKERLIRWRWCKIRKQLWSTFEQVMPSPGLKVFLLVICSLSFVWFVWSKSHSRNQVKTNFVVELYQFTVINLKVYSFASKLSKSTRITY